jgi:hypothetical protein
LISTHHLHSKNVFFNFDDSSSYVPCSTTMSPVTTATWGNEAAGGRAVDIKEKEEKK